jgi:predicted DNA-binding WGR domain protein
MQTEKFYLELSESEGSHKFYEVSVEELEVTIRYGRIGTDGQKSTDTFDSFEAAKKFAQKKVAEKKKKGYEEAVMGVRKKRKITRRPVVTSSGGSTMTSSSGKKLKVPALWNFNSGSSAFGIFVNEEACWVGNQNGNVFKLNHQGEVLTQYKLPEGVKCIIADKQWIYAGCDDGNVYDLGGKVPRIAYEISEDVDIYWLDVFDGLLGVSDADGNVVLANYEGEEIGRRKGKGSGAWMIRLDEKNIYYGDSAGVAAFSLEDGSDGWTQKTSSVLFGWQEKDAVFAGTAGTGVEKIDKATGQKLKTYNMGSGALSCATSEGGKFVFGGNDMIFCFAEDGTLAWKLPTGCGSALSMQYFQGKLYAVTNYGNLVCIDASEEAIAKAKEGDLPQTLELKAPKEQVAVAETTTLETVNQSQTTGKVILKCVKDGSKLRVKVESAGYNNAWFVQFPNNLRKEGAFYAVDKIEEASQGGFYRVLGDIYELKTN